MPPKTLKGFTVDYKGRIRPDAKLRTLLAEKGTLVEEFEGEDLVAVAYSPVGLILDAQENEYYDVVDDEDENSEILAGYLDYLHKLHPKLIKQAEDNIKQGQVTSDDLILLLRKGTLARIEVRGTVAIGIVQSLETLETVVGPITIAHCEVVNHNGKGFVRGQVAARIPTYENKRPLADHQVIPISQDVLGPYIKRGKDVAAMLRKPNMRSYTGQITRQGWTDTYYEATGRVMVDVGGMLMVDKEYAYFWGIQRFTTDTQIFKIEELTENDYACMSPFVYGFSFRTKVWGEMVVENLRPVMFRTESFDQLVLDPEVKKLIKTLVASSDVPGLDFIDGKGGGCIFLLEGEPGCGKAQPLDALIRTPQGWKFMGDMQVGDEVATPDGGSACVIAIHPQGTRDTYQIIFEDGATTECCEDHLWKVYCKSWKPRPEHKSSSRPADGFKIITTSEVQKHLQNSKKKLYIPLTKVIESKRTELPLDPYVLGALLGDGGITHRSVGFSSADLEILDQIRSRLLPNYSLVHRSKYDYAIKSDLLVRDLGGKRRHHYLDQLRSLNLQGCGSKSKFVPELYLLADSQSRLQVLQGLMDTDGTVGKLGGVSFSTVSLELARGVRTLVQSLGGKASLIEREGRNYPYQGELRKGQTSYYVGIQIQNPDTLFTLPRKKIRASKVRQDNRVQCKRRIVGIEKLGPKLMQCIAIDHPDHLYLTNDYIVTHNTFTAEATAETLGRPLHSVSVGELGTSADVLDRRLRTILEIAARWNAVLLLDECDIFLEARSTADIERNAMVGVFLRLLEYYPGILFLTTNRSDQLDPAVYSRISLPIHYPKLDELGLFEVWGNHLKLNQVSIERKEVYNLAFTSFIQGVNGRQVKNCIRQACVIAKHEQREVNAEDLRYLLGVLQKFQDRTA